VQIGQHRYADRYSYLPHIGLLIVVVWGVHELLRRTDMFQQVFMKVTGACLLALVVLVVGLATRIQCGFWGNSIILFTHAVDVEPDNPTAHLNLGEEYSRRGWTEEAMFHFEEARRLDPNSYNAANNLGTLHLRNGNYVTAANLFRSVIRIDPRNATGWGNLGAALMELNQKEFARRAFYQSLWLDPEGGPPYNNLALLTAQDGDERLAMAYANEAIRLKPASAQFRLTRVRILAYFGHIDEAKAEAAVAMTLAPAPELMRKDLDTVFEQPQWAVFHGGMKPKDAETQPSTMPATVPASQPEIAPTTLPVEGM
jgi:protein O-mannosyl-transferase